MYLEKWYADRVVNGRAQILYRANLRLGGIAIGYSGTVSPNRSACVRIGFRDTLLPTISDDQIFWPATANEPQLVWRNACSRTHDLWCRDGQRITWNPLVLHGESSNIEQGRHLGYGYVERLTLNFAPWHLGLDTLKWGRYCGQKHSLVWIEWCGRNRMRLALLDGRDEALEFADRHSVRTRESHLHISNPEEIAHETLGAGALAPLGWMRMFAAQRFLCGIETKWLAEATLTTKNGEIDRGTVIYEEVVWP